MTRSQRRAHTVAVGARRKRAAEVRAICRRPCTERCPHHESPWQGRGSRRVTRRQRSAARGPHGSGGHEADAGGQAVTMRGPYLPKPAKLAERSGESMQEGLGFPDREDPSKWSAS